MIDDIFMITAEQIVNMVIVSDLFDREVRNGLLKKACLVLLEVIILCVYSALDLTGVWMVPVYLIMVLGLRFIYSDAVDVCVLFCIIAFFVVGATELVFYAPFALLWNGMVNNELAGVIGTSGTFICLLVIHKKHWINWRVVSRFIRYRHHLLCYICIAAGSVMFIASSYFRITERMPMYGYLLLIILILIIVPMAAQFIKNELELQARSKYEKPMLDVIARIRQQQHQFDNHLNAMYGMINNYGTYEELVQSLTEYMASVSEVDPCYRLLTLDDPVVSGFLSVKFSQAESRKIRIQHEISIKRISSNVSLSELIGVLGNLFDNAFEEIEATGRERELRLRFWEEEQNYTFEISNPCRDMKQSEVKNFFRKGYSTKGDSDRRGLGLYNVADTVNRHKGKVLASVEGESGARWFAITVIIKRLNP